MKLTLYFTILIILSMGGGILSSPCFAGNSENITRVERLSLARSFVSRMKGGLFDAEKYLISIGTAQEDNTFQEGEILLLQPVLAGRFMVDGVILALVHNGQFMLSLRDFGDVLEIPIEVDTKNRRAEGWYIRENKFFELDLVEGIVKTDIGEFDIKNNVLEKDGEIWIALHELGKWLDFEFETMVALQELRIMTPMLLPIQERYNRRKNKHKKNYISVPKLPLNGVGGKALGFPSVDVATNSRYDKSGGGAAEGIDRHNATIRTVGDFAYGTLITHTQINNTDQVRSVSLNYKRESNDANLLGPLKARRFEVGDIGTAKGPLGGSRAQEMGVRVSNIDALKGFSSPTTVISGYAFPKWDVELFRDTQLLAFKEVGADGFYQFDDVNLFQSDNNFRLVFYGPQGEVREENLFVPVDLKRLSQSEGIYDVSLTLDGRDTYSPTKAVRPKDYGALTLSAMYEYPVMDGTAVSAGIRSSENLGERNSVASTGVSTSVMQTLLNGEIAVDDEGELAAELTLRRSFGEHNFSNEAKWFSPNFDTQGQGDVNDIGELSNNASLSGPISLKLGSRPRYNIGTGYVETTEGDSAFNARAGFSTSWRNFSFGEQVNYQTNSSAADDRLSTFTNVAGVFGKNSVRISAGYRIKPERQLTHVLANYRRGISKKLDLNFDIQRNHEVSLTQYKARLDWQAGFIRISPSVSYNTKSDFFAGLNTRFGILRDPQQNRIKMYDKTLSSNGGLSVFVFVDANGDGIYNDGEEKVEGAVVEGLQNGGRVVSDDNGIALFNNLINLKLTDIQLNKSSLNDPTWIPSFDGVSILPRSGYIAELDFPVHISGELDGVVYANHVPLIISEDSIEKPTSMPLRNIKLSLYNDDGEVEQSVMTDIGGFYYFTLLPPGRYFLIIDEKSAASRKFIRPEPQAIEIGYDGTIIYGNDIFVDMGGGDIPSEIMSDLDDYKDRHPHVDFSPDEHDIVLNLGEYNSRLLMSVVWYKIRTRYQKMLGDAELFVPPAQSFASVSTGKHTLRVGLGHNSLDEAYSRCRSLIARDQSCKVEIYPAYKKQKELKQANVELDVTVQ